MTTPVMITNPIREVVKISTPPNSQLPMKQEVTIWWIPIIIILRSLRRAILAVKWPIIFRIRRKSTKANTIKKIYRLHRDRKTHKCWQRLSCYRSNNQFFLSSQWWANQECVQILYQTSRITWTRKYSLQVEIVVGNWWRFKNKWHGRRLIPTFLQWKH